MLPLGKTESKLKFKPQETWRMCIYCKKSIAGRHAATKYCSTKCGDLYRKHLKK